MWLGTKHTEWDVCSFFYENSSSSSSDRSLLLVAKVKRIARLKENEIFMCVLFSLSSTSLSSSSSSFSRHITISCFFYNYLLSSSVPFCRERLLGYDVSCTNLYHSNKQLFVVSFAFLSLFALLHFLVCVCVLYL